jgi:N-acetylated-alpha-linked acidic dipeptidase
MLSKPFALRSATLRVYARPLALLFAAAALLQLPPAVADAPPPSGFADPDAQLALEARFDAEISAADQLAWMRALAEKPHHVGSPHGQANVERLAALFRSWGYEVSVDGYDVLFPTPRLRRLQMLAPEPFTATLTEDSLPADASTYRIEELLPTYNAFSPDGDVEAELVFVNYGIPEDYETLERYGVDVAGKIVIAKYGRSWRGIKPKLAAEHGAIGALIYSDPGDDGYAAGDTYPDGPFKHESAVQRGSVMDMPQYPGDVLTPGRGATADAQRLERDDAPTIARIPVLPISWRDAEPLLRNLGGEVVPQAWRGALPFTYHLGPGPARVRLTLAFDWRQVRARNVIARLPGSDMPDQWVLRGNHHDGWNHGAADPISGLVALLSEAKALGALAAAGSPPRRTVIYAAWDAEEPGLLGSTEWAEDHADALRRHAVAYINSDGNSRGFLGMGGSHALEPFMNEVAAAVTDPQTGVSVAARRRARIEATGSAEARGDLDELGRLRLSALGSGSDYTPFLQHLTVASLNLSFGGEGPGGSYHTLYDTVEHYTRFRDPELAYGVALAQVAGRATLRLANADVLPFRFPALAETVGGYVDELEALAERLRSETRRQQRLADSGVWDLALDPTRPPGPPAVKAAVPFLNFAPLRNAQARLEAAAAAFDGADFSALSGPPSEALNVAIYEAERLLTIEGGLPERPWYRHAVYAPGFYTGYGVKTLPAVREAIEARRFEAIDAHIAATAAALDAVAEHLEATLARFGAG